MKELGFEPKVRRAGALAAALDAAAKAVPSVSEG
jgi:hypothetical protein